MFIYATIGVTGLIYVNKYYFRQAVTQKSNDINNISRAINDWLISRISEVSQLSYIQSLQQGRHESSDLYLEGWRSRLAFIYSDLFLISPNGYFHSATGKSGHLENKIFISNFTRTIPKYFYMGPVLSEPVFRNHVVVAAPVWKEKVSNFPDNSTPPRNTDTHYTTGENSLTAVLAATIPLQVIDRMIGFFTFSDFDSYMLIDQYGTIIAHSNKELAGKTERQVYGTEFTSTTEYKNNMVFVNVLKTTWKFVTFQPTSSLLQPMRQLNGIVILIFFIILLIIMLVSYVTASRIVKPILELTEGVERIMSGDYRQHIHLHTNDEMKSLAESFNRLSDRMIRLRTDDRFLFLGHISARMAHEMRKPLHIIQLAAQNMATKKEFIKRHTDLILREVDNADRFLKEILNFAKPEMLNFQKYSLSELWQKILPKYRLIADNLNIELRFTEKNEIPPFYIDILKLEEVFSNLMDNAFEATDHHPGKSQTGEPQPGKLQPSKAQPARPANRRSVTVELEHIPDRGVLVSITDSGPGFDESLIDKLFDPYFTTKEDGTGLGLSISYRILTSHGAKIDLKNTPEGHGRVEILFPI